MSDPTNPELNLAKESAAQVPPQPYYPQGPAAPYSVPGQVATNQNAVLALVLGIVAIVALGFITGIPAVVFGNRARREIVLSGEGGATLATVGLVLGWISIGFAALTLLLALLLIGGSAAAHMW